MRAGLGLAFLGATAMLVLSASGAEVVALDNEQFCRAMTEIARLGKSEVGRWLDRNTRDDGVDVLCAIRTINYKRFVAHGPGALGAGWRERKQAEWSSTACNSVLLRDAIDNGWIITSTITAATGERVLVIATCK